jgi:hypothetical protein
LFVRARLIFLGAPASLKFYVSFNEKDRTQFRARGKLETSTQGKSKGKKIRALIRFRDRRVKARRASCVAENVLKYEGTWLLSGTNATFWCRSYTSLAATPPSWPWEFCPETASPLTLTQGPEPLKRVLSCEASADEKNKSPEAPERFLLRTPIHQTNPLFVISWAFVV